MKVRVAAAADVVRHDGAADVERDLVMREVLRHTHVARVRRPVVLGRKDVRAFDLAIVVVVIEPAFHLVAHFVEARGRCADDVDRRTRDHVDEVTRVDTDVLPGVARAAMLFVTIAV